MKTFSNLTPWLNRTRSLPPFSYFENIRPDFELGGFLGIDKCLPLHAVKKEQLISLEESWNKTKKYVDQALEIIKSDAGGWLDSEEVEMIKSELGEPPEVCYPIYLITIKKRLEERVVYVGKTSSKSHRFKGGHNVALKLHDPKYHGFKKTIYFGCIMLLEGQEYLPLDWVHPLQMAEEILNSIEARLIYHLKPELNIIGVKNNLSRLPLSVLHIQNFSRCSNYLNDTFIYQC